MKGKKSKENKARTPGVIREQGNHLAGQRSLYLQQHDHNPVDWYPWGEEALARAVAEDRPIFLSIGYSSCHWCHVMEKEVFEDDAVASFLNEAFVSIKVDREERPDLDSVYMQAVQALAGTGGWPMSVFLTPDQKPFYGGTYFPKDQFLVLLRRIRQLFIERRTQVVQQAEVLTRAIRAGLPLSEPVPVRSALIEVAASRALDGVDDKWGGMEGQMKFPTPLTWHFLLHQYRKTGEERYSRAVRKTLDAMGSGGILDHLGGGFHRYTVEPTWVVPHFEKMLYDNALLSGLYTEAAAVFGSDRYAAIARDTLDFLLREMCDPQGGCYASFDADSGGEEGSFYLWTREEIQQVAGAEDGEALAELLGVSRAGNFEGKNILTRRSLPDELAQRLGKPSADLRTLFDRYREELRKARAERPAPALDRKIITSWNGLAIGSFAEGYALFGDRSYLEAAERCARFLWERHRREDGGLFRSSNEGVPEHDGVLDDYAFFADGLLTLFLAGSKREVLEKALQLLDQARRLFGHEAGFTLTAQGQASPFGRQRELLDHAIPSGNSVMLHVLQKAAALTGNLDYRREAAQALSAYAPLIEKAGVEMAWWLDAAMLMESPFYEVVIAGDPADEKTKVLQGAFHRLVAPHAVLATVGPDGPDPALAKLLPFVERKASPGGGATAYVCQQGSCDLPTSDPEALQRQLLSGWKR